MSSRHLYILFDSVQLQLPWTKIILGGFWRRISGVASYWISLPFLSGISNCTDSLYWYVILWKRKDFHPCSYVNNVETEGDFISKHPFARRANKKYRRIRKLGNICIITGIVTTLMKQCINVDTLPTSCFCDRSNFELVGMYSTSKSAVNTILWLGIHSHRLFINISLLLSVEDCSKMSFRRL